MADEPVGPAEKEDLTLFTGGLFPHVFKRLGWSVQRARKLSIALLPLIAWLPLVPLALVGGKLLPGGTAATPFLYDIGVHIRMLVVLPLLVIAGIVAEQRLGPTIDQFVTRKLVPEEMREAYDRAIASAFRLGDSNIPDIVGIVLIFVVGLPIVWHNYTLLGPSTWFATASTEGTTLSVAGIWYVCVSLPIFQYLLLRWYFRLFIWGRFLMKVARLNLRLTPVHPDRVGGLGFLLIQTQALSIFAMAHGALLAGGIATRVVVQGAKLPDFNSEILVVVLFVLAVTILPLFAFTGALIKTKRRGVMEYGALASRYAFEFQAKWIASRGDAGEPLVGSSDIQSLADMGGSYELVDNMRTMPFTVQMVVVFVIATLLPVAPLLLTVMSLSDIVKKLAGIVLSP